MANSHLAESFERLHSNTVVCPNGVHMQFRGVSAAFNEFTGKLEGSFRKSILFVCFPCTNVACSISSFSNAHLYRLVCGFVRHNVADFQTHLQATRACQTCVTSLQK